ncbi:hypothetical protein JCM6882_007415 [Rhodosporidiobolus microsporus]
MSHASLAASTASTTIHAFLLAFRDDINAAASPSTFASYFVSDSSDSSLPCCIEHGPSGHDALPFLGRPFTSRDGILEYYQLISEVLKGKGGTYDEEDLLVKMREGGKRARAVWTGEAVWIVQKTGKEWKEAVVWAFDLGEVGDGEWKIQRWEVWADTLSAYLASRP